MHIAVGHRIVERYPWYMRKFSPVFIIAFILAFSSITYELLLGQTLSAYLGNTVLRYSVTVGVYMLSMGIGSLLAEGRFQEKPILSLLRIEIALTIIGGGALLFLSWLSGFGMSSVVFSGCAHAFIVIIGILTGFEIPLLMYIYHHEREDADNVVLGIDYIGALFGAIIFAVYFYPHTGLVRASFTVALLNALAGLMLFSQQEFVKREHQKRFHVLTSVQLICAVVLVFALMYAPTFQQYFIQQYILG